MIFLLSVMLNGKKIYSNFTEKAEAEEKEIKKKAKKKKKKKVKITDNGNSIL